MKIKSIRLFAATLMFALTICFFSVTATADGNGKITVNGEDLPVYVLQKAGNDNESFVILLFGDGYAAGEQEKFLADITSRSEAFLKTEPFRTYADQINIYAISTVSKESGVSEKYGTTKDTYFSVCHWGNIVSFTGDGENSARAIKTAMENNYLDDGATVGTIHIISNTEYVFGTSTSALFSFSSGAAAESGGEAMIHEIAHSIGRLKDEYGRIYDGVNASKSSSTEDIVWRKLLGFRGVGITQNGNDPEGYIPSASCIMRDQYSGQFCEVCRIELATRLNSWYYTQRPVDYYVANPDITIEHSNTAVGSEYEKARVSNGNLIKANGKNLELRTVIQNFTNKEKKFKLSLRIIDSDGRTKLIKEETVSIPPLPDKAFDFDYDSARQSVSVKLENVSGIVYKDTVLGEVTDCDTDSVTVTNETETVPQSCVKIHHKIKNAQGEVADMENTYTTTVYVPKGSVYKLRKLRGLNGYTYIGNSLGTDEITAAGENAEIDFYYRQYIGEAKTETQVSDDGKSFIIRPNNICGRTDIILALFDDCVLKEIKHFVYNGDDLKYTTEKDYSDASVFAWEDMDKMVPACRAESVLKK